MWSSLVVGDTEEEDHNLMLVKILANHPYINGDLTKAESLIHTSIKMDVPSGVQKLDFPPTGEGWLEAYTGMSADRIVRQLKKQRRRQKDVKYDIDSLVKAIRLIKSQEVQTTLDGIGWAAGRQDTLRSLGLSDRNLKSLRLFHDTRSTSMQRACEAWENSEATLKMLDEYQDVWGEEEQKAWVDAMEGRKDARKMWRGALRQSDKLAKEQTNWLEMAKAELEDKGPMTARSITENMVNKGIHRMAPSKMSGLLKMYGEEYNIVKGARTGEYVLIKADGLVLKDADLWGYAGGFLDADGSIYITDRGEPRASFIATGTRGRVHCDHLHKVLGCGVLQLDQKVYKDGQRSQHRLSFYSKDDLRKLLTGLLPHLYMKDTQAKAVLAFIDEGSKGRKDELKKLVQYLNWDGTAKGERSLREWGVDKDTVMSWAEDL